MPEFSRCLPGVIQDLPTKPCERSIPLCQKGFNISFIDVSPFDQERYKSLLKQVVSHCCGSCNNIKVIKNFTAWRYISPTSMNTSNIIFPVLGRVHSTTLYGHHFIPFWDVPGSFFLTTKHTKADSVKQLLQACANLWPLVVIMILMALIAGFIVWVMETWKNKEMFPRTFLRGLAEGFWWSFISMTTVGYGDKIPTFFVSRIFSIIWILVGITICSMFTASLTTEITKAVFPDKPTMVGKTIGVMKDRLDDYALVATHGGAIYESNGKGLYPDFMDLVDKVKGNRIKGISISKYVYPMLMGFFLSVNETSKYFEYAKYFLNDTLITELEYLGPKLSFGILVKEKEVYEFLNGFVMDNRLTLETCSNIAFNVLRTSINKNSDSDHSNLFSPNSGLLTPALIITCSILGFIIIFGFFFELGRRNPKFRKAERTT